MLDISGGEVKVKSLPANEGAKRRSIIQAQNDDGALNNAYILRHPKR